MRKLVALTALAFAALLLASACGGEGPSAGTPMPTAAPTPAPEPTVSPIPSASPTPTPVPMPTPVPTPTPAAEEILRRSNEAMGQLEFFLVTQEWRTDDGPFRSRSDMFSYRDVVEVEPEGEYGNPFEDADKASKVRIEREEEYEGQSVWVISYEFGTPGIDSYLSEWRMEWIAKDSYLLLRQERLVYNSLDPIEGSMIAIFSDFNGEPGGPGANVASTDGLLFDGTISGVRVFNVIAWEEAGSPPQMDCDMEGANPQPVSLAATVGTLLGVTPTYLPAGAFEIAVDLSDPPGPGRPGPPAMVCGGQVSRAKRLYRTGIGSFSIEKWRGPNLYVGNVLAEYVSAGEVNGKPAIFVRRAALVPSEPWPAEFWATEARVIIPEEFGFTVVMVDSRNLPFEEALKIAEGLE